MQLILAVATTTYAQHKNLALQKPYPMIRLAQTVRALLDESKRR